MIPQWTSRPFGIGSGVFVFIRRSSASQLDINRYVRSTELRNCASRCLSPSKSFRHFCFDVPSPLRACLSFISPLCLFFSTTFVLAEYSAKRGVNTPSAFYLPLFFFLPCLLFHPGLCLGQISNKQGDKAAMHGQSNPPPQTLQHHLAGDE